jgi:hypothetical protein
LGEIQFLASFTTYYPQHIVLSRINIAVAYPCRPLAEVLYQLALNLARLRYHIYRLSALRLR